MPLVVSLGLVAGLTGLYLLESKMENLIDGLTFGHGPPSPFHLEAEHHCERLGCLVLVELWLLVLG